MRWSLFLAAALLLTACGDGESDVDSYAGPVQLVWVEAMECSHGCAVFGAIQNLATTAEATALVGGFWGTPGGTVTVGVGGDDEIELDGFEPFMGDDPGGANVFFALYDVDGLPTAAESFPTIVGTLDALHLSSLLLWKDAVPEEKFGLLSADQRMRTCAQALGIQLLA